jgi:ketosteroid isomerase-like protein
MIAARILVVAVVSAISLVVPASALALDADASLTRFIQVMNESMPPRSTPAAVAALFADDGVEVHPFGEPPGGPYRGREAIKGFFAGFEHRYRAWTHVEKSRVVNGRHAVWEGVAQGHDRATGKFLKLPIVFFFEFDDRGLVKEHRVYVDIHMIQQQPGE